MENDINIFTNYLWKKCRGENSLVVIGALLNILSTAIITLENKDIKNALIVSLHHIIAQIEALDTTKH